MSSLWDGSIFFDQPKKWWIHRTIGRPRDWPKPHGLPKILSADWLRPENEMINRFYLMHISIPITMILPVLSIDWHIGKIVNWRHDKQVHIFSHFVSPCYALRIELGIHFFHWRTTYFDATLQTLFICQIWCEGKTLWFLTENSTSTVLWVWKLLRS